MEKDFELVSVIIPTYKRPTYLKRAIESVLNQSYNHIEVIVVDDNNEGDEFRVETENLMRFYEDNAKVRYIKHEENQNGAAARNTGIKSAKGKYIAFLDDDDVFMSDKINRQIDILKNLSNTWGGCCCNHVRRFKEYTYKKIKVKERQDGNYCGEFLMGKTSMPSSTLLFRRQVFDMVGLFDEGFERHQDLEYLVRFFRHYRMAVSNKYDLYMQVEGFRNYPSAEKALAIKRKFLKTFQSDIDSFSERDKSKVVHYQWLDVACLFIREMKFGRANQLFRDYVMPNSGSYLKDLVRASFFLLNGIFPGFKFFYYKMVGKYLYNK